MLYAICEDITCGWEFSQEKLKNNNIKVGDKFEVEDFGMGRFYIYVKLKGIEDKFGFEHFRFEDENGNVLNDYEDICNCLHSIK